MWKGDYSMRYLIFAGQTYYANGGMFDLVAQLDGTGIEACEKAATAYQDALKIGGSSGAWCHVWDNEKQKVIWKMGKCFGEDMQRDTLPNIF